MELDDESEEGDTAVFFGICSVRWQGISQSGEMRVNSNCH